MSEKTAIEWTPYPGQATWTAEDERRYQWLLTHIRTCQECDLYGLMMIGNASR